MEEKELVICDTNILIDVIDRGNEDVINSLISIGAEQLCISSISYSELLAGARDKSHLTRLLKELNKFNLISLSPGIDEIHRKLIVKYGLSHGLSIQDSLIAATAIYFDLPLYSLNKRDFKFIAGQRLLVI